MFFVVNGLLYIAVVFWETAQCNDFELCILLIRVRMSSIHLWSVDVNVDRFLWTSSIFNTSLQMLPVEDGLIQGFFYCYTNIRMTQKTTPCTGLVCICLTIQ